MRYLLIGLSYLVVAVAAVFVGVQISHPPEPGLIVSSNIQSGAVPATILQSDSDKTASPLPRFADIARQPTMFRQLYIAYQLAASSDIPTLKSHMDNLIHDDDPFFHYNIANVFLERLIALDVMESIHYIENADISRDRIHRFLSNIVSSWIRHDPEAAIDYVRNIDSMQLKNMIGARLLRDPTLGNTGLQSKLQQDLGQFGQMIMQSANLRQKNPEAAFEEALLLRGSDRQMGMWSAVARWYMEDPEAVLARVLDMDNAVEKKNIMQMLIQTQSQQDPFAALEMVRNYYPQDMDMERQVLMAMTRSDVQQALPYINAFVERTGETHLLQNLASRWSRSDPHAAIDYANTLDKQHRQAFLNGIASGYIHSNPDEGLRWAMSLNNREVLDQVIQFLPNIDISMAENLMNRLDDPQHTHSLMVSISYEKARADPEGAYQWLTKFHDEPGYHNALTNVIREWARHDPKSAADTLEQHQEDSDYQELFSSVAQGWAQRNPDEAISWVRSLPEGEIVDQAAESVVFQIWRNDIDSAIDMMDVMSDERSSSARLTLAVLMLAMKSDEIEDIVDKLDLTEEQADQVRQGNANTSVNHFSPSVPPGYFLSSGGAITY